MAAATDFRKTLDSYRAKAGEFRILDLPPRQYLMIDGRGDPNTSAYSDAISTIYPVAYKLKFASKHAGRDYVVPPLEALWSAPDMAAFTSRRDKSQWDWTLLNLVPDWVTQADVDEAVRVVATRARRASKTCDSRPWRRVAACRRCTSGRSTTRPRRSRGCTTSSSRVPAQV